MTFTQDSLGNTVVPQMATTYYVDNVKGKDTNNGTTPATPVATLSHVYSLVRAGSKNPASPPMTNVAVLLARGGSWNESMPGWWYCSNSVIASYGDQTLPLPHVLVPAGCFIHFAADNVAIFDIEIQNTINATGPVGNFAIEIGSNNVWIEGCFVHLFYQNITALGSTTGMLNNITLRRNRILDSFSTNWSHAQGLYCYCCTNLTLDENTFDHNGWNPNYANATPTEFNHNVYLAVQNGPATITGNIFADASAQGCMARAGGTMDNNLFINNGICGQSAYLAGTNGTMTNNVMTVTPNTPVVGGGFGLASVNGVCTGNIATTSLVNVGFAFESDARGQDFPLTPTCKLVFENNIAWNWKGTGFINTNTRPYVTYTNNVLDVDPSWEQYPKSVNMQGTVANFTTGNNVYAMDDTTKRWFWDSKGFITFAQWQTEMKEPGSTAVAVAKQAAKFVDPNRTIVSYDANFISIARGLTRQQWNPKYTAAGFNDYIREGFGMTVSPINPPTTEYQLSGTAFGTAGSYQNKGNTFNNAVDGNLATFFDGPTANGNVVGLDFGSPMPITHVKYCSRVGWAARMDGGYFQGSNTADFSSGNVTLYTIPTGANTSSTTLVTQPVSGTFRYVRYVSPANSFGNISEMQFLVQPLRQLEMSTFVT